MESTISELSRNKFCFSAESAEFGTAFFKEEVNFEGDIKISGLDGIDGIDLKSIIINQQREIQELKKIVEEIYYAPGMPGYLQAQHSFEENKKRKID